MRLSTKMVLLFSVIMAAAAVLFSSYTVETSLAGAAAFTENRFVNMSTSIGQDIQRDIDMMELTLTTLTGNTSFVSALNQFVRDDSADRKMGSAARTAAVQHLYQTPLVSQYFYTAFFTDDNMYLSSSKEAESAVPDFSPLLAYLNGTKEPKILPPMESRLSMETSHCVYGMVHPVHHHGKLLGYLAVLNTYQYLDHTTAFIDNTSTVTVQAVFEDGQSYYCSSDRTTPFPLDLPVNTLLLWTDPDTQTTYEVMHTCIGRLGLHLFLFQDHHLSVLANNAIRGGIIRRAVLITLPSLCLITFMSLQLTRSIRRLTKKVLKTPTGTSLLNDPDVIQRLKEPVTSPSDKEIHALEQAYVLMMQKLQEQASNEMALREGTLQAHLKALQTQINPHFIYNTLNIISAKSMESGNLEIIEICDQFASMLRYSTDTLSSTATVQEELENVRNYLLLAKARYEDNLEFIIDADNGLQNIRIPKLTLQPLVENALTHGFNGKNILRRLAITGTIHSSEMTLTIRDNGTGFSEQMLASLQQRIHCIDNGSTSIENTGGHIGLINTYLRLHYYSRGKMHISLRNDNGAVVTLSMPISECENHEEA